MRALILDDDPMASYVLVLHLKRKMKGKFSYSIETSPICAVDRLQKKERFDLIITDYNMGEMTGYEVASVARRVGYRCPIIYMTALDITGDYIVDKVIRKPILESDVADLARFLNG